MKKLAYAAAGVALFLATAAPAFASFDNVIKLKQDSTMSNMLHSYVSTGYNSISGEDISGGSITSGFGGNSIGLGNQVNTLSLPSCECLSNLDDTKVTIKQNSTLSNDIYSKVKTGGNSISASDDLSGGTLTSGDGMNDVTVQNIVNTIGQSTL